MTGKQTRGKLKRIWQRVCDVKGTAAAEALAVVALAVALGTAGLAPAMADDAAPTRPAPALEAAQSESAASADADEVAFDEAASAETPAEAEEPAASAPSAQADSPESAAQASSPQAQPTQPQNRKLTLQRTIVTASGVHFTIKVAYDEAAGIPEGAELQLAEYGLEPDDPTWRDDPAYKDRPLATERFLTKVEMAKRIAKLAGGLKVEKGDYVFYTKFLDIAIVANGAEVQPQAPVEVTIETDAVDRNVSDAMEVALDISTTSAQFDKTGYRPVTVKNATERAKDPDNETAEESQGRVKVSFTTDQIANIGLAGVVSPLIVRDEDLGKVAVLGPRSGMGLAAEGMQVSAPDEEAQVLDAFWVRTDPDRDFGTTLWVRNAEARSSVRTIEGITEGVDESTDALVKIDEGAQQASEPATDAIAGWLVNDGSLVGRPFPLGINNVPAAFTAEDGLAIVVGSSISGFEVVDPGSSAEGDQALARYRVTATDGSTYSVSVTFDRTAEIPAGTTLLVTELTGDEYDDYCAQAQEALADQGLLNFARAFDIGFIDKDGNEVEPKAPVEVSITLLDEPARDDLQLLHFGEGDEPELMKAAASQADEAATLGFEAESFSVYLVAAASNPVQVVHSNGSATGYASLQAAYDAVANGETIELLQDITVTEKLKFQRNVAVTLTTASSYAESNGAAKIIRSSSYTTNEPMASVDGTNGANATLTLKNIIVDGNNVPVSTNGGLFEVKSYGTLVLESGAVLQNGYVAGNDRKGGAVYISGGALRMEDGCIIQNCTAERNDHFAGGGVCLYDGDFTMNGGTIRNCHAPNSAGGGIAINHGKTTYINGGLITECDSKEGGAAIECHENLYMTGGTITNNVGGTSGAIDFYDGGDNFYVSGSPRIYGNHTSDGQERNVTFENADHNIKANGDLNDNALIGVSKKNGTFSPSDQFGRYTPETMPSGLSAFYADVDPTLIGMGRLTHPDNHESRRQLVWQRGLQVIAKAYVKGDPSISYDIPGGSGGYSFDGAKTMSIADLAAEYKVNKGLEAKMGAPLSFSGDVNGAAYLNSAMDAAVTQVTSTYNSQTGQYSYTATVGGRQVPIISGATLVIRYSIDAQIKLTDGNGNLLYLSNGNMAIFDELDDAFAALGKCYTDAAAKTKYAGTDYQVMMLTSAHTQMKPVTHATGNYNVTLTTEGASPADGMLPGPGGSCVITNGGITTQSMILTELPSLTVKNIVLNGAGVENASRGALIKMNEGAHSLTIGNATLTGGWSQNQGGAVFAVKGAVVTVNEGASFTNNKSEGDGGAIAAAEETTVTITGATFENNTAEKHEDEVSDGNGGTTINYTAGGGGAIALFNTSKGGKQAVLGVTGTTFTSNAATSDGGAIRTGEQCAVTLTNCTMTSNAAQREGGAVVAKSNANKPSTILVDGGVYTKNSVSDNSGGALRIGGGGTLTVTGDAVIGGAEGEGNSAPNGGAIAAAANTTVNIESGDISYNTVEATSYTEEKNGITYEKLQNGRGGALFLENSGYAGVTLNVTGGSISHNTAQNEGGGVYGQAVTANISDATFEADKAVGAITVTGQSGWEELTSTNGGTGGAMRLITSTATIQRTTFADCFALSGGALETTTSNVTVTDSAFNGDKAHYSAGAFDIHGGTVRIGGVTSFNACVSANPNSKRYTGNGGALYVDASAAFTVAGEGDGIAFTNCAARRDGGAIDFSDSTGIATFDNCHFTGCKAEGNSGGAICSYLRALSVSNSTFENCRAGWTSGAVCAINGGGVTNLTGCTFTNNNSGNRGGAMWAENGATVNISDCTMTGNTSSNEAYNCLDSEGIGNKITFSGEVYIYDNKNGEKQRNVGLAHDTNNIITVGNAGLTENSKIGVYVAGGTDDAVYAAHGDAGMPFGKYYCNENAFLYNFVNDRNGLTGIVYDNGEARTLYWREPLVPVIVQKKWDPSVPTELINLNKTVSFAFAGNVGESASDVASYSSNTKAATLQQLTRYSACTVGGEETPWADVAYIPLYSDALAGTQFASYEVSEGTLANYEGRGTWGEPAVSAGTADSWTAVDDAHAQVAYARMTRQGGVQVPASDLAFTYEDAAGAVFQSTVALDGAANLGAMGDTCYIELSVPKQADLNALSVTSSNVTYDSVTFVPMLPEGVSSSQVVAGREGLQVYVPKERTFVITNTYQINEKSFTVIKKWNDGTDEVAGDDERVENLEVTFDLYQVGIADAPVVGQNVPMPASLRVDQPTIGDSGKTWSEFIADLSPSQAADTNTKVPIEPTAGFFWWEDKEHPENNGWYYCYSGRNPNYAELSQGPASGAFLENNGVKFTGTIWSLDMAESKRNGVPLFTSIAKGDLIYADGKYYACINNAGEIEWTHQTDRYKLIDGGSISDNPTPGEVVVGDYTTQDQAEALRSTLPSRGYSVKRYGTYTVQRSEVEEFSDEWFTVALNLPEGYGYYVVEMAVKQRGTGTVVTRNFTPSYEYSQDGRIATITNTFNTQSSKVILKKIDDTTKVPLAGAQFDVMTTTGEPLAQNCVSTENGVFYVGDLFYNSYYLKETARPDGYGAGDQWFRMDVAATGTTITPLDKAPTFDSGGQIDPDKQVTGYYVTFEPSEPNDRYMINRTDVAAKLNVRYDDGTTGVVAADVYWSTSDGSIATVSSAGALSFHNVGVATITATLGTQVVASQNVYVMDYDVGISPSNLVRADQTGVSARAVLRYGANSTSPYTGQVQEWAVQDTSVAEIDALGNITPKAVGVTVVKAKIDGRWVSTELTVIESLNPTGEKIRIVPAPGDDGYYEVGDWVHVELWTGLDWVSTADVAWAFNISASGGSVVFWSDANGVRLDSVGSTQRMTITATIDKPDATVNGHSVPKGLTASKEILVKDKVESALNTTELSGTVGGSGTIGVSCSVNGQTQDASSHLTYSSSNASVAAGVNGSKTINYLAEGTATITVYFDGKELGAITVTVNPKPSGGDNVVVDGTTIHMPVTYVAVGDSNGKYTNAERDQINSNGGIIQGKYYVIGQKVYYGAWASTDYWNYEGALVEMTGFSYGGDGITYSGTPVDGDSYDAQGAFNAPYGSVVKQDGHYYLTISTSNYYGGYTKCANTTWAFVRID